MSDQFSGSFISGKSDDEIEAMIAKVKICPRDQLYTIVRNSFINEAEHYANTRNRIGGEDKDRFNRLFFKRMDELMRERGLPLLRAAGVMK